MQHISSFDWHQVSFTLEERVGSAIGFDFWMRLLKNYNTIPLILISTTNQNLLPSKETFLTDWTVKKKEADVTQTDLGGMKDCS